jgi:hypothetical protein
MNRIISKAALAIVLGAFCQIALAQWVWKDEAGHTVYSDQPPPPNVSKAHIMKSPGASSVDPLAPAPAAPAPADSAADGNSPAHPKSLAEQDLDYKKRQKDAAEAAKKKSEEDAKTAQNAQRCEASRQALATLQSGVRIQRSDDQGQRYYLDDSQRASEVAKLQQNMQGC